MLLLEVDTLGLEIVGELTCLFTLTMLFEGELWLEEGILGAETGRGEEIFGADIFGALILGEELGLKEGEELGLKEEELGLKEEELGLKEEELGLKELLAPNDLAYTG
jgi:hypothetical protein